MAALYDTIGTTYARYRQPDARWQAAIDRALGDARTVANIGAGSGSYEPSGRDLVAVEPALTMIRQRPSGAAPVVQAVAEHLPFADGQFDATLAILTTHHWPDTRVGLAELARVSHKQVILTHNASAFDDFWLTRDYIPELPKLDQAERFMPPVLDTLRIRATITVPIPWDCTDGFLCSYWRRPEMYLDPDARAAISGLALLPDGVISPAVQRLADDIESGVWDERYGHLRGLDSLDLGYCLIVADGLR